MAGNLLNRFTLDRHIDAMTDRFTVLDFRPGGPDEEDILSTTNTYTSAGETKGTSIIYLDMRNDLAVLRSCRVTSTTATGGNEPNVWTITAQDTTEEKVEIRLPQETIPVFDSTSSSTSDFPEGFIPNFIFLGGLPFETPIGPQTMGGLVGAQHNQGVWGVGCGP